MELTPNKLKALCEVGWSAFVVGRPPEGSLDKTVVNEVYGVIVGKPGHLFLAGCCPRVAHMSKALSRRGL
jgi:hypothetical protein